MDPDKKLKVIKGLGVIVALAIFEILIIAWYFRYYN